MFVLIQEKLLFDLRGLNKVAVAFGLTQIKKYKKEEEKSS